MNFLRMSSLSLSFFSSARRGGVSQERGVEERRGGKGTHISLPVGLKNVVSQSI